MKNSQAEKGKSPSWNAVKAALANCDRLGLLKVLQDLYHLDKSNQSFFHARFLTDSDALETYKERIYKSLAPDLYKSPNQDVSVAEAKRAVSEYRKAVGRAEDMLELHVFWCEAASDFTMEYGYADEGYFDALIRQYELALKQLNSVDEATRNAASDRLLHVRNKTDCGYGVRDDMNALLDEYGIVL